MLTLVALLFVNPDRREEFERYERSAATIMRGYGGTIERRVSFPSPRRPSDPHELHLVTFPDRDSFDRYRSDPELAALAELRAAAIRETVVWEGVDLPPFES
jgi:uncharacterized protein (DUF1330 family)